MTGVVLPSRVVSLVIRRPPHFTFKPGDYIFVNIPAIASFEWHPFTISSAPEQVSNLESLKKLNHCSRCYKTFFGGNLENLVSPPPRAETAIIGHFKSNKQFLSIFLLVNSIVTFLLQPCFNFMPTFKTDA